MLRIPLLLLLVFSSLVAPVGQFQQQQTVGVMFGEHTGYTLFMAQTTNQVYMLDDQGRLIHEWRVSGNGRDAFLRENGNLVVSVQPQNGDPDNFASSIQFARIDGRFEEYTWDGELVWAYEFDRPNYKVHHGIQVLPNGHVMFVAWEYKSVEEALAAGRNPEILGNGLWPDVILEYSPEANDIVWEWHVWDHLIQDFDATQDHYGVVGEHPELVDVNFTEPWEQIEDWMHSNATDYNPELDQVLISVREFNEVWIIDHSTTTEEASGEAGNLLYRWGNPRAYRRGDESTRQMSYQHDIQWVPAGNPGAGNILLYSNRQTLDPTASEDDPAANYSKIVEFTPPLLPDGTYALEDGHAYGPTEPTWTYDGLPNHQFYSRFISGAQRLPNGNTLIIKGFECVLFEVTPEGEVVWEYVPPMVGKHLVVQGSTPDPAIFRARRYQPDFAGLVGRDLTPGPKLEDLASTSPETPAYLALDATLNGELTAEQVTRYYVFDGVTDQYLSVSVETATTGVTVRLLDNTGQVLMEAVASMGETAVHIESFHIPADGLYSLEVSGDPNTYQLHLFEGPSIS